jgi:hypothetical protein
VQGLLLLNFPFRAILVLWFGEAAYALVARVRWGGGGGGGGGGAGAGGVGADGEESDDAPDFL